MRYASAMDAGPGLDRSLESSRAWLDLVARMSDAATFPDASPDAPVEVVQTHASVVFLVGDRAWKIKKPVHLGFLDFSTLERRRADAEVELVLNRRMAPDLYLGVWPVVDGPAGPRVVRDRARQDAVEWAVEMRRLPSEGMLDRVIARGELPVPALLRFADELAAFHARADDGPEVRAHGAIEVLRRRIDDNLARLARYGAQPVAGDQAALDPAFVERLGTRTRAWLEDLAPTLERRRGEGRVRDGHGDLHARNLCLVDGVIRAYDCLEFEPAYRCADVAMEVAFLSMDLDRLGHHEASAAFVDRYVAASGDEGVRGPWRFFRLHYAIVRAMVEAIRLAEPETPAAERPAIRALVRSYATLAAGYLVEPATILLMGLPATGKSTLARALAGPFLAGLLRSDAIRKGLAGIAPTERGAASLYSEASTERTYRALAEGAVAHLGSVVLDAAHLRRVERGWSLEAAAKRGGRWVVVETVAAEAEIARRLEGRAADPTNISDATPEVVRRLAHLREAPEEIPARRHVVIEAGTPPEVACLRVAERLLASGG